MWGSDNAIFNVNGAGIERLKKTLELVLGSSKVVGWKFKKEFGIILYESDSRKDINLFPVKIPASQCAEYDTVKISGKVKEHTQYRGVNQTVIQRPKFA